MIVPTLMTLTLVVCLAFLSQAGAQTGTQPDKASPLSPVTAVSQHSSIKAVPLLEKAVQLSDFNGGADGMQPSASVAGLLTHIEGFIQTAPFDGKAATESTEVWMGRTASAIFFIFACHDQQAGLIRTHLARRENILKDDQVSVLLDPFQDHRRGVLFTVNPSGVQADAAWTENVDPDYSYDQVWDSDARVTSAGWLALISIPFRSLRFAGGSPGWGVVLTRQLPRRSETDNWPRVSANVNGTLTQEATLTGIEGSSGSRNIQLNPYALAQRERTLNSLVPGEPFFSNRKLEGTAGGEAKAVIKDSIVVDATVNPDFSQVESDQPQFTVNQRYAVFFPELRPFFLENANYFTTPIKLVYTRNIVHPEFGIRATGKVGRTNIGLLAIDDRAPGEVFAQGTPLAGKHSVFGIGRVSQDIGKGSSIGLIYTDQEFAGGWNRIGGIDFTARFNDHWSAQGQVVGSSTRGFSTASTPSAYAAGPASQLEVTRTGHSFYLDSVTRDYSTGFQTQVGFVPITNIRANTTFLEYEWYPKQSILQSYGVESSHKFAFDHQGNRIYHVDQADFFFALASNTVLAVTGGENSDTLTPSQYPVLNANHNFTENFGGLILRSSPLPQFSFRITALESGNVNYNPVTSAAPSLLHQDSLQALVTLQPLRSLTLDNTYLLDRNRAQTGDGLALENQTLRTKINYQFTRALSARVIVEYDSLQVNPLLTSLARTKQVGTQVLFTWLPHPGTAIYLGYNNDLQNLDRSLCNRTSGGTCDPAGQTAPRSNQYLNDGRQIFLKASYLLRF